MAFRGLFIGIDHYASPEISWLSCASRDATALSTLFTDTLGGESVRLTDQDATRSAIEDQFHLLADTTADDVVVIGFSGHGSDTHELITHDADIHNLADSCIPLDVLMTWFSQIPARRLLCILDCCFSGGMGAKVLHAPLKPRHLVSTGSLLDKLSGEGRLIFTASTATEPAWENQRLGHGLLTYYLLQALQGAEEVRQAGQVSTYPLLNYVTQRVVDASRHLGKAQHPTMRGQIDGELLWPIFVPGEQYRTEFPERVRSHVDANIHSLATYGFPQTLLDTWASSIPGLNPLQQDAINQFNVLDGDHLVVSAPTSSGKTMIGELAVLKGTLQRQRSFFLLPLRALVNDKHKEFSRRYATFGLRTIRATGEITDDIPALMRGQYDICLMTYEKFSSLVLGQPNLLDQVRTIVIDEVQMITDQSRGTNLEFLLTLLQVRRQHGVEPQLIALSAVIGDTNGLERWLDARLLRRTQRPVPLNEGIIRQDGSFQYLDPAGKEQLIPNYIQRRWVKDSSQDWIIPLIARLVKEGKQVIVFRETRGETRGCARYLARELGLPPADTVRGLLPAGDPSLASGDLQSCLAGGVAFHNSDLDRDERLVIEDQFRAPNTPLRVLVATTTLAMGVNTPTEAVVIAGLQHPVGVPYSVAEYKNMAGRAGRLGFATEGNSYLLALTQNDEHYAWNHYVLGVPEDLHSRFLEPATDPRSLIARVLAASPPVASTGMTAPDIVEFLEGSFGAFQQAQLQATWQWDQSQLLSALQELEAHDLVEHGDHGTYHLTLLGRLAGEGGVEVTSLLRIIEVIGNLQPAELSDATLVTVAQLTQELDDVFFPLNRKSTRQEPVYWPRELQNQLVPSTVLMGLRQAISDLHQPTLRAKKAVACLLWMSDMPLSVIEQSLTQFGGSPNGAAGAIRSVSRRTADLLPTVLRVAEIIHPDVDLAEHRTRLLARLELGIPAAATDLGMHVGNQLTRSDYQRLLRAELIDIDVIERSDDQQLLDLLSGNADKLAAIRRAVEAYRDRETHEALPAPLLSAPDV